MKTRNLKVSYHIADTMGARRNVTPDDVLSDYESFDEAFHDFKYNGDGDCAILANINGEWYRVSNRFADGVPRYKPLDKTLLGWHTLEETVAGVDISNVPFKNMLAMAAAISYCNGNLAKELGVEQETLNKYGFWEKFSEFFGYPMYEAKI